MTFNAEYDALAGIGHACGHNLIATASLAAFVGVAAALKERATRFGLAGRVRLLGTPAEESGGGKKLLIDAGAFEDVDACFMSHPGPRINKASPFTGAAYGRSLASAQFTVSFFGKPAHAAMAPYQGVNALDGLTLAYNAISMLRQQTRPYDRIHFIVDRGGDAANIIPSYAVGDVQVRSATIRELEELKARVKKCFEGSAIATGCKMEIQE